MLTSQKHNLKTQKIRTNYLHYNMLPSIWGFFNLFYIFPLEIHKLPWYTIFFNYMKEKGIEEI